MNILFLTYQGDIAGSTYSISYLARGLAARGHHVYVGCRSESLLYSLFEDSGVKLIPMEFRSRFSLRNMLQINKAVRAHRIDIINAQSSYDRYTSVFSKWIFRHKAKIVHTRRQISASIGGFLQNLIYVKGADEIIAVSRGVKNSLVEKGIPGDHVRVIYNGTPREKYDQLDADFIARLKDEYSIKPSDFVIGCVSRKKKQEQVLQALERVPFRTKVIFVGIEEQPDYEIYLKTIRSRHDIFFTGVIPARYILNYYKLFTVKILASTIEGLSQALLEAMALEVPVVATACGGNPELIQQGENGFLFEDNDIEGLASYIRQLHDQPALLEKFAEAGRLTAFDVFSIERTVRNYEAAFYELIQQPVNKSDGYIR